MKQIQKPVIMIIINMKVTAIPNVIGAQSRVTKGLVLRLEDLEIRGQVETI